MNWLFFVQVCVETISLCTCPHLRIRRSHTYEYTYKHKRAICTFQIANTLHFTLYTFDLFTINYILYDIYYLILLNFYIYHNFRKNTRWVTEVTEVTRAWLSCLPNRLNASGYRGYPGYPGYLLPFFMGKMLLIIYNIIKLLYIPQFQKKNTWGNRGNRGNQGLRGLIARNPGQRRTTSGTTHCHVKKK